MGQALVFVYYTYRIAKDSDRIPMLSHTFPAEYINLFKPSIQDELQLLTTYNAKGRNAVTELLYNSKYELIIYKIDLWEDTSLYKIINIANKFVLEDATEGFNEIEAGNISYKYADSVPPVRTIKLTLYGDSINKVINNDTTLYYWLKLNNLSISYNSADSQDIYVKKSNLFMDNVPMELMLLKKDKELFFIAIYNIRESQNLQPKYFLNRLLK